MNYTEIVAIISSCSALVAIFFAFKNNKRTDDSDIAKEAEDRAENKLMLRQISSDMKDVKASVDNVTKEVRELRDRVVQVEQSTKSAHHRLDDLVTIQDKVTVTTKE